MFAEDLFQIQNIFPIYTWKIFHTRPDKIWTRHFLLVHQIDGKSFVPPADILELQEIFPSINMYTFSQKIRNLGLNYWSNQREYYVQVINENFKSDHQHIEWELVEKKFNVILYHLHKETLYSKSLGLFQYEKVSSP